jgi:hypothetical protein
VDAPNEVITCLVEAGGRNAKAVIAAADGALACLRLWTDCVRSAVSPPVVFVVTTDASEATPHQAPSITEDGRLRIPITVPTPLPATPGHARRLVLDLMTAGLFRAAEIAPNQPPQELWLPQVDDETPEEPVMAAGDLIHGALLGLKPHEVFLTAGTSNDTDSVWDKVERIDNRLASIVNDGIPEAILDDTFTDGDTRNWILSIAPDPDDHPT